MPKIVIKKFTPAHSPAVCRMVRKTFTKFVAPTCTMAGTKIWLSLQTPARQIERAKTRPLFLAFYGDKIVGMIEIAENRVSRLFVDPAFHKTGIGKKLMSKAFSIYKRRGEPKILKINSSTYAIPFYEKIGFKRFGGRRKRNGIVSNPMIKRIKR